MNFGLILSVKPDKSVNPSNVVNVLDVYEKDNGSFFMSIIEPTAWNKVCTGSTKLETTNKWIKI